MSVTLAGEYATRADALRRFAETFTPGAVLTGAEVVERAEGLALVLEREAKELAALVEREPAR